MSLIGCMLHCMPINILKALKKQRDTINPILSRTGEIDDRVFSILKLEKTKDYIQNRISIVHSLICRINWYLSIAVHLNLTG